MEKSGYINRFGYKLGLGSSKTRIKSGLVRELMTYFKVDQNNSNSTFRIATIDMNEGDGLSRTTEEIIKRVSLEHPTYIIHHLSNDAKSFHALPSIAYTLGVTVFMRLAVRNKLAKGYLRVFGVKKITLVLLSIVIGLFGTLLTQYFKNYSKNVEGLIDVFTTVEIYASSVVISIVLLIGKFLTEKYSFSTESNSIHQLKKALSEEESGKYNELINKLVADLANAYSRASKPRLLIIDNYSRLDKISKRVILKYIDNWFAEDMKPLGKELLFSFEAKENTDKLGVHLLFKLRKGGASNDSVSFYNVDNISLSEKEKLVLELGLDKNREKYNILRNIINSPRIIEFEKISLVNERSEIDRSCLLLVYFISLSSIPNRLLFTKKTLIELLDYSIVKSYINLSDNSTSETYASYFLKKFHSFIRPSSGRGQDVSKYYYVTDSAKASLVEYELTLEFPKRSLGHAIWVVVKYNYIKRQTDKLYWFISLKNHFINCSPSDFRNLVDYDINNDVILSLKESVTASLSNGQFYHTNQLVGFMYDLVKDINSLTDSKIISIDEVNELAWNVYFSSKDVNVLARILDEYSVQSVNSSAYSPTSSILTRTYFKYVPNPGKFESTKNAITGLQKIIDSKNRIPLKLYVESVTGITSNIIRKGMSETYFDNIEEIASESLLFNQNNRSYIIDNDLVEDFLSEPMMVEGLINSIWLDNYTHYNRRGEILTVSGWDSYFIYGEKFLHKSYKQIQEYVKISESVLSRIANLNQNNSLNYVEFARLGELALILAASTYINAISIERDLTKINLGNLDETFDEQGMVVNINRIYSNSASIINLDVEYVSHLEHLSSSDIVRSIKSTFDTYSLIWSKFDIPEFGAELNNRRIQFELFINSRLRADTIDMNLVNALEQILKQQNYLGLTSNLLISEYLKKVSNLTSLYFNNAATLSIDSQFDKEFAKQLAYTTLLYHQKSIQDATYLVDLVMSENKSGNSFLYDTIISSPEKSIFSLLFNLTKNYSNITDEKQLTSFKNTLALVPNEITNSAEKRKAVNLFEWIEASNKIKKLSEQEAISMLRKWSDRKDLFFYAAILIRLFNRGFQSEYFKNEVVSVVKNPGDKTFNTYLILANAFAKRFLLNRKSVNEEEFNIIVPFLENEIGNWEDKNDVSTNSEIYTTLYQFYPHVYEEKFKLWMRLETEVFHKSTVIRMLESSRFFMILKQYVDRTIQFSVPLSKSPQYYIDKINMTPEDSKSFILKVSNSTHISPPLENDTVNVEFIIIGNALLKNISDLNASQRETLSNINLISKQTLPRLIDLLLRMPKLPRYFKEIMENYYRHFDFYSKL